MSRLLSGRSNIQKLGIFFVVVLLLVLLVIYVGGGIAAARDDSVSSVEAGREFLISDQMSDTFSLPDSPEGLVWVTCTPIDVAVFEPRIHVHCNEKYNGVEYFAIATDNAASSARFLTILTTAQVAGRVLQIQYDPDDTSGAAWGCNAADCRRFRGVEFGQ